LEVGSRGPGWGGREEGTGLCGPRAVVAIVVAPVVGHALLGWDWVWAEIQNRGGLDMLYGITFKGYCTQSWVRVQGPELIAFLNLTCVLPGAGTGKSTLMNCLTGVSRMFEVRVRGERGGRWVWLVDCTCIFQRVRGERGGRWVWLADCTCIL
jgi:hypothetical protein